MLYSKIVNPKTGRKVNVGGKIGRQILRNYLIALNGGSSPSYLLPRTVRKVLKKINPNFAKYTNTIYLLMVQNRGSFPEPSETYGGRWQYDALHEVLVSNGIDNKDAESMINYMWTSMIPKYRNFTPALLKQLELAGIPPSFFRLFASPA